uniref:Glucan endo-1,3-beta-D-glucosidase n=1 Tax=Aegilops tauschii subsp. strangulata TaxID=200361 RepID=A0A453L058_AEGTS
MAVAGGSGCLAKAAAVLVLVLCMARWSAAGMGVNWGTQLSHPLPASTVVRLLKDNGFDRVKLFDAEDSILGALKGSGIQVMVGIPNDMLWDLAGSTKAAERWVTANVSKHVNDGVDIRNFPCSMQKLNGF